MSLNDIDIWLVVVFANLDKLAKHLDPARLAVTEAVFGLLLAALAVQMILDGLADLGIISAIVER
jgi:small neutral amino acid transporter SnatA (MarC family)